MTPHATTTVTSLLLLHVFESDELIIIITTERIFSFFVFPEQTDKRTISDFIFVLSVRCYPKKVFPAKRNRNGNIFRPNFLIL